MTKPIVRIYLDNDEFIDREMNAAEYAVYQADQAKTKAREAEIKAKAEAKQEILDRLGLTADEAKLLLG